MKANKVIEEIKSFAMLTANKTCTAIVTDVVHARGYAWFVAGYLEFTRATHEPEPDDKEIPWFKAVASTEGEEIEIEDFESMISEAKVLVFINRAKKIAAGQSDETGS